MASQAANTNRHTQIYEKLVERLSHLQPGDLFPTVADLMHEFSVSQVTITQAIQRLQHQGLIKRPVGKKRYVITQQAQRREAIIAVLRPTWPSPEYDSLLSAIQQDCTARNWNVAQINYQNWADLDLQRLIATHDGLICIGYPKESGDKQLAAMADKAYPFVTLMDRPEDALFGGVQGDDLALGRMAVETLRSLGHKRIAVLLNEPPGPSISQRLLGWRTAMEAAGETNLDELVIDCSVVRGQDSIELGRQSFDRWMEQSYRPFTAIFATAWTGALAIMRVMHDRRIELPAHCSLLAQGGLWPIGRFLVPPLSTIDYNAVQWGKTACDLLAEKMKGGTPYTRSVNLAPEIHLRGTTLPFRG